MRADARKLAKERIGTRIDGKWLLDDLLGFGGCAAVYAATHRNGARAAVKVLHPHCVDDELIRTRFIREGYVANKVSHPGVVRVLDDDETAEGVPYLVMELLEGRSLEPPKAGGQPMSVQEVVRVADEVLDVLASAHEAGIVHRDLKPANLFITTTGQIKVIDFGIARLAEVMHDSAAGGATQTGTMMGTASYMPPEQARARWSEVDGRADLWALGATMLTLLLGRRPRAAETSNEDLLLAMTEPMPLVRTLLPTLAPALASVIDRSLAFRREDRWSDARAMQAALRGAGASKAWQLQTQLIAPSEPAASSAPSERAFPPSARTLAAALPVEPATWVTPPTGSSREAPISTTSGVLGPARSIPPARSGVGAALLVMVGLLMALTGGAGIFLYLRARHPVKTTASALPPAPPVVSATAPVEVEPPPEPTEPTTIPPPPPPTTTTTTTTTTAAPSAAIVSIAPGAPRARPRPAASAKPSKYLEERY